MTQEHSAPPFYLFLDLKDKGKRKHSAHSPHLKEFMPKLAFLKYETPGLWAACQGLIIVTLNLHSLHLSSSCVLWRGFVFLALFLTQGLILQLRLKESSLCRPCWSQTACLLIQSA